MIDEAARIRIGRLRRAALSTLDAVEYLLDVDVEIGADGMGASESTEKRAIRQKLEDSRKELLEP